MQLSLINHADEPELIVSPEGGSWSDVMDPDKPFDIEDDDERVLVVGDRPDLREHLEERAAVLMSPAARTVAQVVARKARVRALGKTERVTITIENHGDKALRVNLGGTAHSTIAPGSSQQCYAPGYLELHELVHAPQEDE
jgi:hypothetical protein